jgi:hypothetical protein
MRDHSPESYQTPELLGAARQQHRQRAKHFFLAGAGAY